MPIIVICGCTLLIFICISYFSHTNSVEAISFENTSNTQKVNISLTSESISKAALEITTQTNKEETNPEDEAVTSASETAESAQVEETEVIEENVIDSSIAETVVEEISPNKDSEFTIASGASSFKSYMDYRAITNRSSLQYKMQQQAYTDENGLRKIGDYYCVAMGTYYGNLGDKLYIETDEGASWKVILADIKSDAHTDSTHRYTVSNHCMMEFIVDTPAMSTSVKRSGTVNSLGFQGKICYIEKIG